MKHSVNKTATYEFTLFADFNQFYLQDENASGIDGASWSEKASARMLAVEPDAFAVGTARNMDVSATIEIWSSEPAIVNGADMINECSIDVLSGKLVVAGCSDYLPDAARINLPASTYRARISYENLSVLSDDGLEGEDKYTVQLWTAARAETITIKKHDEC